MALQVYISKKGTKVVAATELHQALQLTDHHYATNVKRWLQDIYEFRDGIRRPEKLRDYGARKLRGSTTLMKDYYLTLEFAKLITLSSKSKAKLKYAKWLDNVDDLADEEDMLTKDQVMRVLELTKAMVMISCQQSAEKRHLKVYESRNGGSSKDWWKYRAKILGYSAEKLRRRYMAATGREARGKSQREMLLHIDPYELIRTAIIDLFMGMGKSNTYALKLGDLAKSFAKELQLEVYDDRQQASLFAPQNANDRLVNELRMVEQGGQISVWQ
jgi:phage anti-repressor protein